MEVQVGLGEVEQGRLRFHSEGPGAEFPFDTVLVFLSAQKEKASQPYIYIYKLTSQLRRSPAR